MKMISRRPPDPRLSDYIESMASIEQTSPHDDNQYLDIPTTHSYITFHLVRRAGKIDARLNIVGSHSVIGEMPLIGFENAGARVKPGFLSGLLGVPAHEVQGRIVPLENVWGRAARDLLEKMWDAPTTEERLQIMEETFIRRLDPNGDSGVFVREAARIIQESRWNISIDDLSSSMGFTKRQLERQFLKFSGFTPKEYFKTTRCRSIIQRISLGRFRDWGQLVHDYNYCDQSHFIREFGYSMKQSPSAYFDLLRQNIKMLNEVNPDPHDTCNLLTAPKKIASTLLRRTQPTGKTSPPSVN